MEFWLHQLLMVPLWADRVYAKEEAAVEEVEVLEAVEAPLALSLL
jgi:hypothetical protein